MTQHTQNVASKQQTQTQHQSLAIVQGNNSASNNNGEFPNNSNQTTYTGSPSQSLYNQTSPSPNIYMPTHGVHQSVGAGSATMYPTMIPANNVYVNNVTANVNLHGWTHTIPGTYISGAAPHYIHSDVPSDQNGPILQTMPTMQPLALNTSNVHSSVSSSSGIPGRGPRRGRGRVGSGLSRRQDYNALRHPLPEDSPLPSHQHSHNQEQLSQSINQHQQNSTQPQQHIDAQMMGSVQPTYTPQPQYTTPYQYAYPTTYYTPQNHIIHPTQTATHQTPQPYYVPVYQGPQLYNYQYISPIINPGEYQYVPAEEIHCDNRQNQDGMIPQMWHPQQIYTDEYNMNIHPNNSMMQNSLLNPSENVSPSYQMYDPHLHGMQQRMDVMQIYDDPQLGPMQGLPCNDGMTELVDDMSDCSVPIDTMQMMSPDGMIAPVHHHGHDSHQVPPNHMTVPVMSIEEQVEHEQVEEYDIEPVNADNYSNNCIDVNQALVNEATQTLINDTNQTLINDTNQTLINDTTQTLINDTTQTSVNDTIQTLVKDSILGKTLVNDATQTLVNDGTQTSVNDTIQTLMKDSTKTLVILVNDATQTLVNNATQTLVIDPNSNLKENNDKSCDTISQDYQKQQVDFEQEQQQQNAVNSVNNRQMKKVCNELVLKDKELKQKMPLLETVMTQTIETAELEEPQPLQQDISLTEQQTAPLSEQQHQQSQQGHHKHHHNHQHHHHQDQDKYEQHDKQHYQPQQHYLKYQRGSYSQQQDQQSQSHRKQPHHYAQQQQQQRHYIPRFYNNNNNNTNNYTNNNTNNTTNSNNTHNNTHNNNQNNNSSCPHQQQTNVPTSSDSSVQTAKSMSWTNNSYQKKSTASVSVTATPSATNNNSKQPSSTNNHGTKSYTNQHHHNQQHMQQTQHNSNQQQQQPSQTRNSQQGAMKTPSSPPTTITAAPNSERKQSQVIQPSSHQFHHRSTSTSCASTSVVPEQFQKQEPQQQTVSTQSDHTGPCSLPGKSAQQDQQQKVHVHKRNMATTTAIATPPVPTMNLAPPQPAGSATIAPPSVNTWASLFSNKNSRVSSHMTPLPVPNSAVSTTKGQQKVATNVTNGNGANNQKKPVAKVAPYDGISGEVQPAPEVTPAMSYSAASSLGLVASASAAPASTAPSTVVPASVVPVTCVAVAATSDKPIKAHKTLDEWTIKFATFLSKYKTDLMSTSLRPRGLTNRSNYCYINSILQALVGCAPFYNMIRSIPKQVLALCDVKTPTINAMHSFVGNFSALPSGMRLNNRLNKAGPKGKDSQGAELQCDPAFEPTEIYKLWNESRDEHVEGRQEDAEEFLGYVLNKLNDEMLEAIKLIAKTASKQNGHNPPPENDEGDVWQMICNNRNKGSVTRQTDFGRTPLSDIFRGELRSRLQREGEHSTDVIQPFFTLQLNIEKAASVKEALEILVGRDQLEGVTGSKSKQEVVAWQQMTLEKLPVVLILHLKWFDYRSDGCTKILKTVEFPVELKIDPKILSSKKYSQKQRIYRLFAVVYHDGKEASKGHYITDVFHTGYASWLRFDDSSVKPVSEHTVLHPHMPRVPYLLCYRRCDTMPHGGGAPNSSRQDSSSNKAGDRDAK